MNAHLFTDVSGQATPEPDYAKVVEVIRALRPDKLAAERIDDTIMLIEWLQAQVLAQHDALAIKQAELETRAAAVSNERKQAARQLRAAHAVMASAPRGKGLIARLLGR